MILITCNQTHAYTSCGQYIADVNNEPNTYFTHSSRDAFEYATAYGLEVKCLYESRIKMTQNINGYEKIYYLSSGNLIGYLVPWVYEETKHYSTKRSAKRLTDLNTNSDEIHV